MQLSPEKITEKTEAHAFLVSLVTAVQHLATLINQASQNLNELKSESSDPV